MCCFCLKGPWELEGKAKQVVVSVILQSLKKTLQQKHLSCTFHALFPSQHLWFSNVHLPHCIIILPSA